MVEFALHPHSRACPDVAFEIITTQVLHFVPRHSGSLGAPYSREQQDANQLLEANGDFHIVVERGPRLSTFMSSSP
jgi:hypothetical protein